MKIGNVIYEGELVNHTEVDYVNYINTNTNYELIDTTLPTLYVGWSFMKQCNPNNLIFQKADILAKTIVPNKLYWELSFKEGKASHVKGVDKFVAMVPEYYFEPTYDYVNIDPVFFQIKNHQDLMDNCPKNIDKIYQYKEEMIYLLTDNTIWGINLEMYKFFQFDIDNIIHSVGNRLKLDREYLTDFDGEFYQSNYKIFPIKMY